MWFAAAVYGQTTAALISGRVVDSLTGRPVPNAEVSCVSVRLNVRGSVRTDAAGRYALLSLPPGAYGLRVTAAGYQANEVGELELAVAARLEIGFRLRPLNDVWESSLHRSVFLPQSDAVLTFYGPDVDTSRAGSFEPARGQHGALETTLSDVVDPLQVRELPLAGRDVYTMLVAQAGVAADAGTARGLGLSIHGQRPSASNFMLDGIENNNYLVTGPLLSLPPEAVQEYRVSTANFSAEYGRTSGYLANAVTRSGGNQWHGIGYWNGKHESLFANGFQENRQGDTRPPYRENQTGVQAGGPLRRKAWFISAAFDHLRARARGPAEDILLPAAAFPDYTAPESIARSLIERFPRPQVSRGIWPVAPARAAPSVSTDRTAALVRLDRAAGSHHTSARFAFGGTSRPDFIWTPYRDFVSGLWHRSISMAVSETTTADSNVSNEFRFGWSTDLLQWDRAHPEIPTLWSLDGTVLPGSPAFYAFRNRGRGMEISEGLTWNAEKHLLKFGGGLLLRQLEGYLTAGRDGRYVFGDFLDFAVDAPLLFSAPLARRSLPDFQLPRFDREYRFPQFHFFAQDTVRASPRWVFNAGLRWEHFGSPVNSGPEKDGLTDAAGKVVFPGPGGQQVYGSHGAWAPRVGFSFRPRAAGSLVFRGAYGLFYDRPFDNLWQNLRNNGFVLPNFLALPGNYLQPVEQVLPKYRGQPFAKDFPSLTRLDPALKNGYAQSAFLGLESRWSQSWSVQVNGVASLGRRLITTDLVKRNASPISYRSTQGLSNYYGLTAKAGYRFAAGEFQAVYTWGHAIDVQSEPLAGDFFDLTFTRAPSTRPRGVAAFLREGDPRADRGNSDFDQRHNLVLFCIWEPPRVLAGHKLGTLFRNWQIAQFSAFRTGFPYTVYAPATSLFYNNRADMVSDSPLSSEPVPGGLRLLHPAAFRVPPPQRPGNTGRNAFRGPGLYNVDLSLSRTIPLPMLGETVRIRVRIDAFNALNHANLNSPDSFLGSETFGMALYGRTGRDAGFPALVPFRENPRNLQLTLKFEY